MNLRHLLFAGLLSCAACATTTKAPGTAATGAPAPAAEGASSTAGATAADFVLPDSEGGTVRLSDHRGRVVLLDFMATWCTPCEAELPHLEAMHRKWKDRGVSFIGIAMDGPETISTVPSFVRRHGLTFPVLLDEETKVTATYNPRRSAPLTVLIGRDGRVASVREGFAAGDEAQLEAELEALVGR